MNAVGSISDPVIVIRASVDIGLTKGPLRKRGHKGPFCSLV